MTSLYTAIMKAADHIERYPQAFDFGEISVPPVCGTPGCALGWIGHFAELPVASPLRLVAHYDPTSRWRPDEAMPLMGVLTQDEFYDRMDAFCVDWRHDATNCANALRLYAEKYHGHEKPQVPDWLALASGTDLLGESSLREQELVS